MVTGDRSIMTIMYDSGRTRSLEIFVKTKEIVLRKSNGYTG